MYKVFLAIAIVLAFPAVASAGLVRMVARDVPAGGRSLQSAAAPMRFNMLAIHWRGAGTVEYRTRSTAGRWGAWTAADADPSSSEGDAAAGTRDGNLAWVGASDAARFRTSGPASHVRAYYLWSKVTAPARRTILMAGLPAIVPRSGWLADEKIKRASPRYASVLKSAIVHHTAGTNTYTRAQAAAIVRGIEVYHVKGNGWNDIGYNFLIDRFGTVYEGRAGGTDRNVIGAHSLGFNTGTVGVSLIGNFASATPPAGMQSSLVELLAWRLDVGHIDPLSFVTETSLGNPTFKYGKAVTLRAISGHRDTGPTECPGKVAYRLLPSIATRVSLTGLPKLYSPVATGALGGSIRFQGRLSSSRPWTVTVTGTAGAVVAKGKGATAKVDWTWSSAGAGKGPFTWSIEAGSSVLPASGTIGAPKAKPKPAPIPVPVPLPIPVLVPAPVISGPLLSGLTLSPDVVSPSSDGSGGYVTVNFTLAGPAAVTAQVTAVPPAATLPRTLLSASLEAGDNSFSWSLAPLADGHYQVSVTAKPKSGSPATQSAPVTVDRSLTGFTTTPSLISPNADGVNDATTLGFTLAQLLPVQVVIQHLGTIVGTAFSGQLGPGPQVVAWDGTVGGVRVPDGTYDVVVLVTDALGAVSFTLPVTVDTTPPALTLLDPASLRFQLNEAATMTVTVNGQVVVGPAGAGVFTIPWAGGPVATIFAQAADAAGNLSPGVTFP